MIIWVGDVACMGKEKCNTKCWLGNVMGRDYVEDLDMDGKIILEVGRCGLDASGSEQGQVVGSCEHGNEPLCSIKGGEIYCLDEWLLTSQEGSAPRS
jgi:hypothetical protein